MLYLPEIKDAQTIIIYNMTNEEIWKTGYVHKLSLVSLPNGFYTVKYSIDKVKAYLQEVL